MSMDKRWTELFTRLEAVEKELKELKAAVNPAVTVVSPASTAKQPHVVKK